MISPKEGKGQLHFGHRNESRIKAQYRALGRKAGKPPPLPWLPSFSGGGWRYADALHLRRHHSRATSVAETPPVLLDPISMACQMRDPTHSPSYTLETAER